MEKLLYRINFKKMDIEINNVSFKLNIFYGYDMKISVLFFISVFFLIILNCINFEDEIDFIHIESKINKNLTIVRHHIYGNDTAGGYYIVNGFRDENKGIPQNNYVKISEHTLPLWINMNNDEQIIILYSMGEICENKLIDDKIIIKQIDSLDDIKEKYGYDPDNFKVYDINKMGY